MGAIWNDKYSNRHKHMAVSLTLMMILSKCSDPVVHWYLFLALKYRAASGIQFSCPLG